MLTTISIPAALISIRSSLADNLKRLGYHLTEEELDDLARNVATAIVTLDAATKPTPMSRLERAARRWRDDPDAFQRQADLIHAVDALPGAAAEDYAVVTATGEEGNLCVTF